MKKHLTVEQHLELGKDLRKLRHDTFIYQMKFPKTYPIYRRFENFRSAVDWLRNALEGRLYHEHKAFYNDYVYHHAGVQPTLEDLRAHGENWRPGPAPKETVLVGTRRKIPLTLEDHITLAKLLKTNKVRVYRPDVLDCVVVGSDLYRRILAFGKAFDVLCSELEGDLAQTHPAVWSPQVYYGAVTPTVADLQSKGGTWRPGPDAIADSAGIEVNVIL